MPEELTTEETLSLAEMALESAGAAIDQLAAQVIALSEENAQLRQAAIIASTAAGNQSLRATTFETQLVDAGQAPAPDVPAALSLPPEIAAALVEAVTGDSAP